MPEEPSSASNETRAARLSASAESLLETALNQDVRSRLRVIIGDCDNAARAIETSPKIAAAVLADVERRLDEIERGIADHGPGFKFTKP